LGNLCSGAYGSRDARIRPWRLVCRLRAAEMPADRIRQGAIGYLLARQPSAHATILIGAVVRLIVGTLCGWQEKRSRICCADAKILAGLLAGVSASLFALILGLLFEELVYPKSAMAIAPIAILGLGVGGTTGFLFMLMAASLDPDRLRVTDHLRLMERVQGVWLPIAIGTAASCGVVGVMRSLLRVRWYDL